MSMRILCILILKREDIMRTTIVCLLLLIFLTAAVSIPVMAAPLFPDVPDAHWAKDAVTDLASKGILEGYPDGTFKGDRSATRWEMALMLQRTLARMEQEHSKFALKADLEALRALVNEYKDELDAYGVRVKNVEEAYSGVEKRTNELERIRFYGLIQGSYPFVDIKSATINLGTRALPVNDWTNGRILQTGSAMTTLAKLGTIVRATENSSFGIELAGFNTSGDPTVADYWGLTPPYLSNTFTSQGSPTPAFQAKNNTPWTRVTLDRFWYRYKPTDTSFVFGSFSNEKMDGIMLKGERNLNINYPEILPFYGLDVKGRMNRKEGTPWSYEVCYTKLPQQSFFPTHMIGGSMMYEAKQWEAKVHYLHVNNTTVSDGTGIGTGSANAPTLAPYPLAPGNVPVYWRTAAGSTVNSKLGPQVMDSIGLDVSYKISKKWSAFGKAGFSSYDPDSGHTLYNVKAKGQAFALGVKTKLDKFDGSLTYQYASDKYDPFILQYPVPGSGLPAFLPYSTYYFNYYQLHDYITYPSNRQGVRLNLGYDFSKKTRLEGTADLLGQVKASTVSQFSTVGNVEPLFPYLQTAGSAVKGNVMDWGLRLSHNFTDKFQARVAYFNYMQKRAAAAIDDIDLKEDLTYLNLHYDWTKKVDVFANYYYVKYQGHTGLANAGFKQSIPSATLNYKFNKDVSAGVTYRHYDYKNTVTAGNDWTGNSWIIDYKMNF